MKNLEELAKDLAIYDSCYFGWLDGYEYWSLFIRLPEEKEPRLLLNIAPSNIEEEKELAFSLEVKKRILAGHKGLCFVFQCIVGNNCSEGIYSGDEASVKLFFRLLKKERMAEQPPSDGEEAIRRTDFFQGDGGEFHGFLTTIEKLKELLANGPKPLDY